MNNCTRYFVTTNRLGFRKWRGDDLDLALGLWGDYEVTKFIDARGKLSDSQIQDRLMKEIRCEKEHGVQYWPIFLLANDEHVGCCGLRPYDLSQKTYEIGFHIRSKYWWHGYASEAASATIEYAFNTLRAASLFAGHNPKNKGSRYLLGKLGFLYTHDEYYEPTGLQHPSYLLTVAEYQQIRKSTGESL